MKNTCSRIAGLPALSDQRGSALILALGLLVLMSMLGVLALGTTNTELGITGNYRASQEAYHAADRAVEYAMTSEDVFSAIGTGTELLTDGDTATEIDYETHIAAGTGRSGLREGATNQVTYLRSGPLPPGSGSDPTYFQSRFYAIEVTGEGPRNTATRIDAMVSRIVPK